MKRFLLLFLLISCTVPHSAGKAGILIPAQQLPKWAAQPNQFQLSHNEIAIGSKLEITIGPADYAWGIAYVYTDNKIWERLIINPLKTKDSIVQQWVRGTAKFTLDISKAKFTPDKTYYVVGYLCNKRKGWECNGNKWMLLSFKVAKPTPPAPAVNIEDEIAQLEKELDELDNEEKLLEELP